MTIVAIVVAMITDVAVTMILVDVIAIVIIVTAKIVHVAVAIVIIVAAKIVHVVVAILITDVVAKIIDVAKVRIGSINIILNNEGRCINMQKNDYVSNLIMFKQLLSFNNGGCSAGDGCDCDGDPDECIENGQD